MEKDLQAEYVKNKTKACNKIASHLVEKHHIITVGDKILETYVYDKGQYIRAEKGTIFPMVQDILKDYASQSAKSEVFSSIQAMSFRGNNKDIFKSASLDLLPLANGVYNVTTKELLPHSHEYYFSFQFPVLYNKEAQSPNVHKFLDDTFTETQRLTIEEWIGYIFHRNYMLKKALIIVGEGDTGKTTFLELISALIGLDNISGVTLNQMSSDKFATQQMYNKHANIYDELSTDDVEDTTAFKMATGNGNMTGEQKFGERFQFVNFAKLTFACNKIPDVKDVDDEAYFNRWMVIRLEKTIEEKILNFIERISTEEELSGLFNIAMVALERLKAQGHFTYKGIDTKKEMLLGGNSVGQFATKCLEPKIGEEISKSNLYDVYTQYCLQNNMAAVEIKTFGKRIVGYAPYITDSPIYDKSSMKGRQVRGWKNVAVKKTEAEQQAQLEDDAYWASLTMNVDLPS